MLQLRYKNSSKNPMWLVESKYSLSLDNSDNLVVSSSDLNSPGVAILVVDGDTVSVDQLVTEALIINGKPAKNGDLICAGDEVKVGKTELTVYDPKSDKDRKPANSSAAKATPQQWALRALSSAMSNRSYPLSGKQILGRSKDADISLNVVHLSRRHAELSVSGSGLQITDLGSSNGTFVNGKKITTAKLVSGDELSFDTLRFRVEGPDDFEAPTQVRYSKTDEEHTTVRPAIKAQPGTPPSKPRAASSQNTPKQTAAVRSSRATSAANGVHAATPKNTVPHIEPIDKSNNRIIFIVFGVIIAAVIGYFFFS